MAKHSAAYLARRKRTRDNRRRGRHMPETRKQCPQCGVYGARQIVELFGAGWRWYCDGCKHLWPEQVSAIYTRRSDA